jgi:hypothetical protein
MEALDGNAIAGALFALFGAEMTAAGGTCSSCGAAALIAELRVYVCAPGIVVRCPACDAVAMVLIEQRGEVHCRGFTLSQ